MKKYPRGLSKRIYHYSEELIKLFNPIQEGVLKSPNPSKMPKMTPNEQKNGMKADVFIYYEKIPEGVSKGL